MTKLFTPDTHLTHCLHKLGEELAQCGLGCAVAESCTGGLLGAALTSVPGSSAWFYGGIIAYANAVKTSLLGVEEEVLREYGAVSEACVQRMAEAACRITGAQVGVSISGVAGPGGGSVEKPVGTVWLGFWVQGRGDALLLQAERQSNTREDIRTAAVRAAVQGLRERLPRGTSS